MKARVAIVGAAVLLSCGHAALDRSKSRGAHESGVHAADVPVRGFDVEVKLASNSVSGELIAVDRKFVYVNIQKEGVEVFRVSRSEIREVEVAVRPSAAEGLGVWTGVGCASTVSHGAFLIFTGPIWLASGIGATASEANDATAKASRDQLDQLYQYARFPQGLPPSWGGPPRRPPPSLPAPTQSASPAQPSLMQPQPPPAAPSGSAIAPPTAGPPLMPASSFAPVEPPAP